MASEDFCLRPGWLRQQATWAYTQNTAFQTYKEYFSFIKTGVTTEE